MRFEENLILIFFGLDRLVISFAGISKNNPLLYTRATGEEGTYASCGRTSGKRPRQKIKAIESFMNMTGPR